MGFKWVQGSPSTLSEEIGARGMGGVKALEEIMQHVAEDGAEEVRRIIETTPSGIVPGKPDRIWTGQMHEAVGFDPLRVEDRKVTATFGWVGTVEEYYLLQEAGVGYVQTPMHAILGAFIKQREELFSLIREWTR